MSLKLTFNITLKSDYHISAGHGKGALIDSALLRDGDGVPVIRGTTLTGLLRDGLWRLLQTKPLEEKARGLHGDERYCGQYATEADPDLCPLCRLFGTPRRPKAWRISSARPAKMQEPVSGKHQPEGQTVARARISPRTRRAEPRKLFSQEEGDGRWTFQFTVTWPTDDAGNLDEAALLTAAARNVRQLGRSRRRGQGECLFTLVKVEGTDAITPAETDVGEEDWQTPLLERFARRWIDGKPASPSKPSASLTIAAEPSGDAPVRVRLFVRTDEPLLIAKRAEAGNQFESLSVITGQVIRGALAWRAARRYDLSERESETYAAFVCTFLRDDVLFPDLYPAQFVTSALRPTIPAPRDLLTCKIGRFDHGFWFATEGVPEECAHCGSKAFTEVKAFVKLFEDNWSQDHTEPDFDLERSSEMHIRIDQEKGRVSEGDLFGYVALDAGQYFIGDLICVDEAAWKRLQALAHIEPDQPIVLRLGKARRRGYGKVTAWFQVNLDEDELEDVWIREPLQDRMDAEQRELQMTLLTDTIITDRWGRFATGFESGWLSEVLAQNVEIISAADGAHAVDGFDANLGLPRWRDIALVAGSTVRLQLEKAPDLDLLRRLEQQGIGLRRNEGFGRVAFNHPVYSRCQGIASDIELPPALKPKSTRSSDEEHFRDEWEDILGDAKTWKEKCHDKRFRAVARWLHANRRREPKDLKTDLKSIGELPEDAIELLGGKEEYGKRYGLKPEKDRLAKHPGIKGVDQMLTELEDFDEKFWPLGIQMLAERIAAAAGAETGKEERK
ncbi:MAG: RAMP superfamily CRISPR-associated protein [Anaerolineae bacterium]